MQPSLLRLPLCCHPKLPRRLSELNSRQLVHALAASSVDDNGSTEKKSVSSKVGHLAPKGPRAADTQDIFVEDLEATLEAHRARNRASVIRKVTKDWKAPGFFFTRVEQVSAEQELADAPQKNGKESSQLGDSLERVSPEEGRADASQENGKESSELGNRSERVLTSGGIGALHVAGDLGEKSSEHDDDSVEIRESVAMHKKEKKVSFHMWPMDSIQRMRTERSAHQPKEYAQFKEDVLKSDVSLEYTGVAFWPTRTWKYEAQDISLLQRPWLAYIIESSDAMDKRLSQEIRAFESYLRLTPAEDTAASIVVSDVNEIVAERSQEASLTLLGSRRNGLATPTSDFDFSIFMPFAELEPTEGSPIMTRNAVMKGSLSTLGIVRKILKSSKKFFNLQMIIARVPILVATHRATRLMIQVQTKADYQPAQKFTTAYLTELPSLRPLYVLIRHCLEIRGLTTVHEGGLGSYSLFMMIAIALKHAGGRFATDDLAGQLIYVLDFYGNADLYRNGVAANPPRIFDKSMDSWSLKEGMTSLSDPQSKGIHDLLRKQDSRKPYLLCLQDPADASNDLGKNSYAIKHIQATFKKIHQNLVEMVGVKSEEYKSRKEGSWSCLDYLVRADHRSFELHRSRVECIRDPIASKRLDAPDFARDEVLRRARDFTRSKGKDERSTWRMYNTSPLTRRVGLISYPRTWERSK